MRPSRIRSVLASLLVALVIPLVVAVLVELALLRAGLVAGVAPWRIILLACAGALVVGSLGKREKRNAASNPQVMRRRTLREAVVVLGPALVAALLLRTLVAEPFVVPTGSMLPTLQIGDHVYASKLGSGLPKRGQIAVFRRPGDRRLIKRVVGLPGDSVATVDGRLVLNGEEVPRCTVGEVTYMDRDLATLTWRKERGILHLERLGSAVYTVVHDTRLRASDFGPALVPAGQVFVMGDNRDHSWDSRSWGGVPLGSILGRARVIWWSSGPASEPLRLGRMGHLLGTPAQYGELIGPCLEQLERGVTD
jgi:signal peptidase I